jgi:hypothetical protein
MTFSPDYILDGEWGECCKVEVNSKAYRLGA